MSKKIVSYNLDKELIKKIADLSLEDGRKNSDWLNRFLTSKLLADDKKPAKGMSTPSVLKFDFKKELILMGVDADTLADWLKVRKTKKSSNTKTALKALLNEVDKAGLSVNQAVEFAAAKSWAGFKAQWYANEINTSGKGVSVLEDSANSDWHLKDQGF